MKSRREVIQLILVLWSGAAAVMTSVPAALRLAYAGAKKLILPKGTPMDTLINRNPADLDARNLEITPVTEFDTMGLTSHAVSTATWRLEVAGAVKHPLKLNYSDVLQREVIERDALLICPGFFAYKGRWKGVSVSALLKEAQVSERARHVVVSGPGGPDGKSERFSLEDALTERLILAYQVNGKPLPEKHGFPLRLVAPGHYGAKWVKFVDTIEVTA